MSSEVSSFSSVCRVCMGDEANTSLFVTDATLILADKIMACANIQIQSDDKMPSQICNGCVEKLETAYDFKTLCELTDSKLRQHLIIKLEREQLADEDGEDKPNLMSLLHLTIKEESLEFFDVPQMDSPSSDRDNKQEMRSHQSCPDEDINVMSSSDSEFLVKRKRKNKKLIDKSIRNRLSGLNKKEKKLSKKDKPIAKKLLSGKKKSTNSTSPKGPFPCEDCDRVCATLSHYVTHRRVHSGERPFKCDLCPATFALLNTLQVHRRMHTGEKPYTCDICGNSFRHKSHLATHNRIHSGAKPYSCPHCPKTFRQSGSATNHIRLHTGEKPFVCNFCGKTFSWKKYLTDHLRVHTGEQPYKCKVCGKGFKNTGNIRVHMRTHTGEKPYECDICHRKFSQMDNMINHKNGHEGLKPYACLNCDKCFIRKSHLSRHKKTHLGTHKPSEQQQCQICSKWVVDIKKHLVSHEAEKNFQCAVCNKKFSWSNCLSRHLRNVHSLSKEVAKLHIQTIEKEKEAKDKKVVVSISKPTDKDIKELVTKKESDVAA